MKLLFILSVFVMSTTIFAKVVAHEEQSLGDDLNFKLEQTEQSQRNVASEKSFQFSDNETHNKDSKEQRAPEEIIPTMQFWKY